jgi:hypothetical protein
VTGGDTRNGHTPAGRKQAATLPPGGGNRPMTELADESETVRERAAEALYLAGLTAAGTDAACGRPFNYARGCAAILAAGVPRFIFLAGRDWPEFDTTAGVDRLEAMRSAEFVHKAGIFWRRFDFQGGLEALCRLADPEYLYRAGRFWRGFDHERGLTVLVGLGTAKFLYYAGQEWPVFNYPRGLAALLGTGSPEYIFYAGAHWREFDFRRGFEVLLAAGNCEFLYKAGTLWQEFDFERAWRALEREVAAGTDWRGRALTHPRWRAALRSVWARLTENARGDVEGSGAPPGRVAASAFQPAPGCPLPPGSLTSDS